MDYLNQLGPLVLASRLKNLSDTLMQGVVKIYREMNVDFEPRWFPVTYYLYQIGPAQVTHLAKALRQSHPAVLQVANSMHKHGMVKLRKDSNDKRKTIISLSPKGKKLAEDLEETWKVISQAAGKLLEENYIQILEDIALLEDALDQQDVYTRIKKEYVLNNLEKLQIVEYSPEYHHDFKEINYQWLNDSVGITAYDRHIIEHPQEQVLDKGGKIFMALAGKEVTGTVILQPLNNGEVELTKLAVKKAYRRLGIGRKLTDFAIEKAGHKGFSSILLLTHPALIEAISLYKSIGFIEIPARPELPDKTGRCSLTMQLDINK